MFSNISICPKDLKNMILFNYLLRSMRYSSKYMKYNNTYLFFSSFTSIKITIILNPF